MSFIQTPISLFAIRAGRRIAEIEVQVTIEENANDVLTITKQPVQTGASITDHAYKEPTILTMQISFRANPFKSLSKIYSELLTLQNNRVPFNVVTPKRIYKQMLINSLSQTTDKFTENCLMIRVTFQEVIIVKVASVTVPPRARQRNPGTTGKTENGGRKSALATAAEGVLGVIR